MIKNQSTWLVIITILIVLYATYLAGVYVGVHVAVNAYRKTCEPMSSNAQKVEWLECKP